MADLVKQQTREIAEMLTEEDIEIGRYSSGWDADTDFDALPPHLVDVSKADVESAELFQGDEGEATEFEAPVEHFPMFKGALRHFQDTTPRARAVRIDTDKSYEEFGAEKACKELERRINELREHVEAHEADHHGGAAKPMRQWDEVLGAVSAISDLQASKSGSEAISKMPQVPLTVPEFAQGHVKCWQDGDAVIVSIRFAMPDGSPRIATMGTKPKVDAEGITAWAEDQGIDPVTVLGIVPVIASVATGKKLVRDTATAALDAQCRPDVEGMSDEEPIVLIGLGESTAPLAALMYLQQRAEAGDPQAQKELGIMQIAAKTPTGRRVAAPVLAEADRRLRLGRAEHRSESYADQYARLAAFV
jgi:hypothetical protein